jgi:hAT family C-terminal dimerisation region
MRKYRSDDDDVTPAGPSSSNAQAINPPSQFLQLMMEYDNEQADEDISFTGETIDEEYASYVSSVPKHTATLDPLKFWEVSIYNRHSCYLSDFCKTNRETFPTLFKIALDYLPVQASSVPCERAFSSSAETDTNKRNRIAHDFMESLQILKFGFKKERLNFTGELLTTFEDLTGDSPEDVGKDPLAEHLKKGKMREADGAKLFNWDDDEIE